MQTITIAPPKRSWFSLLSWAVVLAVLVVSWQGAEMAPLTLIKDGGNMATFAADFFPPDFSQWQDYLTEMAVTLQIAVWGTALAVVLSIPFGLMSAENLVPWWVYQPVRRLMDACRAINEMVFAMLFVVAVGLGFNANLRDPNMRYHLALLDGEVVGMIGLHLQFHLHHVNWIGEIQELVVMPQARGLNVGSKLLAWAEEEARQAGAEMTELSTNVKRHDAHRFYLREGYEQSHFRFTKAL